MKQSSSTQLVEKEKKICNQVSTDIEKSHRRSRRALIALAVLLRFISPLAAKYPLRKTSTTFGRAATSLRSG